MTTITFKTQELKDQAIAAEKAAHPAPTTYQAQHLVALEAATITG